MYKLYANRDSLMKLKRSDSVSGAAVATATDIPIVFIPESGIACTVALVFMGTPSSRFSLGQ